VDGVLCSHRITDDEPDPIDAEGLAHQAMLAGDLS
jgi:hypothetical protein